MLDFRSQSLRKSGRFFRGPRLRENRVHARESQSLRKSGRFFPL